MKNSCEDLPPASVEGAECNGGDGKDDYVFVNDSDVALDDQEVIEGNNVEMDDLESNVADCQGKGGDQLDVCNGILDNVVELNVSESKIENGLISEQSEDVQLVKVNGEIKSEDEGEIEDGKGVDETGDRDIVEESCVESVVNEAKDGELGVMKRDNGNASLDGVSHPSLVEDDKTRVVLGVDNSDTVQNDTSVEEPEPHVLKNTDLIPELNKCLETQAVLKLFEGADNENDIELIDSELDLQVLKNTVQSDETTTELMPEAKGTHEISMVDILSDDLEKPVIDCDLDGVDGEGEAELRFQMERTLESSAASVVDEVSEERGLVNVIDMKASPEDANLGKAETVEEATNQSMLRSSINATSDEESKDPDASHFEVGVSGNEVNVAESSHDSGSCLRSEDDYITGPVVNEMDLSDPCESDITREHGVVVDSPYAGDNCISYSAVEFNCQPNMESNDSACPGNGTETGVKPVNDEVDVVSMTSCDSVDTIKSKIIFGSFECIASFANTDFINIHADVLNRSDESNTTQSDLSDDIPKSIVHTANGFSFLKTEDDGVHSTEFNHGTYDGVVNSEQINTGEILVTHQEGSWVDSVDGLDVNPDLLKRPFYYLIRLPRFDDVELTEQKKKSDMEVQKKTLERDAVLKVYHEKKAAFLEVKSNYNASRSKERAANSLMTAKKQEIDAAQSLINLARNAVTVEDIDGQILYVERRIQHETLSLAEERNLVREIKRLNQQRDQLAANTRRQQELHQALDQRVETEERLKVLRKEYDALRENHAKAYESFTTVKRIYDGESASLNSLKVELTCHDDIRQKAWSQLQDLKKKAYEKNEMFYRYKDGARIASDYAKAGKMEDLEQHCVNQVEKFMDLWNKNDEFRTKYVKCNRRSTLRRFRTLDGRSLGPDEEPPSLEDFSNNKDNASAKIGLNTTVSLKRDFPLVAKKVDEKSVMNVAEQKIKPVRAKNRVEPTSKNKLAEPSGRIEPEKEDHKLTKEEEELVRKAEEKKREEEAAQLREKRRLEEKAKAQEALERKEKLAKKAKARAEFKAKKEAEEKKKETEKRAKKNGKKGLAASTSSETEPAQSEDSALPVTSREPEVTEKPPVDVAKKSRNRASYTKQVKTTKSVAARPVPLRQRSKRRIPQWTWWLALALLSVVLIFPLGNIDILLGLKTYLSGNQ
ncbi:uncharacterized protein LOC130801513 isoform X2 [Amaranthus tricolor]|nr:uncharacterized protein LOC130801513 isoform X2 [Amaranthus tricolor]XP_057521365.1 uncharacterized protein LOC130801513 isoform X2 [Amaranthus tricolor]